MCNNYRKKWITKGGMRDGKEIIADWGVSRAKAYEMIKDLNKRFREINSNFIVINGKANRKFYEESCYGAKD